MCKMMQEQKIFHFVSEEDAKRFKESWERFGMSIFKLEQKGSIVIMTYSCNSKIRFDPYPFSSRCQHCVKTYI